MTQSKQLKVFVNYRRADERIFVELLRTHFMYRYGRENVFMDFDSIPAFAQFEEFIRQKVREADVVAMIISKRWLELRREKEASGDVDYVMLELEESLKHGKVIAPICIQGAEMPDLPDSLRSIGTRNAAFVSDGQNILDNITRIMNGFEAELAKHGAKREIANPASQTTIEETQDAAGELDIDTVLDHFTEAVQADDLPQALVWLAQLRSVGAQLIPPTFDLDGREARLQAQLREQEDQRRRREVADFQYKFVRRMVKLSDPPERIEEAIKAIWQVDGGYIPDDLKASLTTLVDVPNLQAQIAAETRAKLERQAELARKFREAEAKLRHQREQFRRGAVSREELESELRRLTQLDDKQQWWMMGIEDDQKWYRYDNNIWVEAVPDFYAQELQLDQKKLIYNADSNRLKTPTFMPKPFAWIPIPAGKVSLVNTWDGDENVYLKKNKPQTFDVPTFSIAKYPVTNAQFAKFIEAGGYDNSSWWTADGWQTRQKEKWTQPHLWTDSTWDKADHPVVGVSWYEAMAFCLWLSDITGENITLPTEQQWQRAAQGDDGRAYPWGKDWDGKRCNNSVDSKGKGATTPVTQYEGKNKGDSPYGITDLSGNVWEWCLTVYDSGETGLNGTDVRVLRGGTWVNFNAYSFRAEYRGRNNPGDRSNGIGFRVVSS